VAETKNVELEAVALPSVEPVPGHPRVLAAAVVQRRRWKVVPMLGDVVAAGGTAVLVTADGARTQDLPPGLETIDLVDAERMHGLHMLIARSPMRVLNRLAGRDTSGPSWAWATWSTSKPYRALRPWVLWRVLRRQLDELDIATIDHVVIVGQESWPIAWHLCRRNPAITVAWDVPDEVYERFGRRPIVHEPIEDDEAPDRASGTVT
jgi:hypothetical protein